MSATVTYTYDDGSEISFFDVPDSVTDSILADYLFEYPSSLKV
jgi:hypothetical protein